MKDIFKNDLIKVIICFILFVSLATIICIGETKQNNLSRQLSIELNAMEFKDNTKNLASAEKLIDKNNYTYIGINALGNYNNVRWKNKKWYVLGDGISATNNYQLKVKALCAISEVINDSKANRLMGDMLQNITAEKLKDVDLITVLAGTNDYAFNTKLGTISDSENANTFYGSLKRVINGILKVKKDANIVFLTPLKRGAFMNEPVYPNPNNVGFKLDDYVQAIKDVCKSYNILVLDTFNKSGITENNIKEYTIDNLSLNEKGYKKISQLIADYFKTINN